MQVFVSWSGDHSRRVAEVLREWLPTVIQALKPWVSAEDIQKGQQWFATIQESLAAASGMGIFCLTPENLSAPWISFEAGVIAGRDQSMVATFLHGLAPDALRPPLSLFQATNAGHREDVLKLLTSINKRLPEPLPEKLLAKAFDANWNQLEAELAKIEINRHALPPAKPPVDAVLAEVLATLRRLEKAQIDAARRNDVRWRRPPNPASDSPSIQDQFKVFFTSDGDAQKNLLYEILMKNSKSVAPPEGDVGKDKGIGEE